MKTTSLRALVVAARLERSHAPEGPTGDEPEGPPGNGEGRAERRTKRRSPDPA